MAVFVDDLEKPFCSKHYKYKVSKLCRMIADTTEELVQMMELLGIPESRLEARGSWREMCVLLKTERMAAVKRGAILIPDLDLFEKMKEKMVQSARDEAFR